MNPATPLRAEITLHVDGTWQQGVDCEPAPPPPPRSPPGITCARFHAVGLAGGVTIIKAGLQVEISQLYLTASATGLQGALLVITQEEEESPHLIKAVRGQRQAKVHSSPLADSALSALFKSTLPPCCSKLHPTSV